MLKRRGWTAASGSGGWLMLIWGCYRQPPYLLSELPSPMIIQWHNPWWQTGLGKIIRWIYWGVKIRILAHADNPALGRVRYQQEHCDHFNKSADQNFKMPPKTAYQQKAPSQYTSPSPLPHQIIWDYRKTYIDGKSPSKAFTLFTLMKFLLKGIPWLLKYLILVQLTLTNSNKM